MPIMRGLPCSPQVTILPQAPPVPVGARHSPLSQGNSDVNIFAASINQILEPAVSKWASHPQRGFIKGRQMFDNAIEVEAHMATAALTRDSRRSPVSQQHGLVVLPQLTC